MFNFICSFVIFEIWNCKINNCAKIVGRVWEESILLTPVEESNVLFPLSKEYNTCIRQDPLGKAAGYYSERVSTSSGNVMQWSDKRETLRFTGIAFLLGNQILLWCSII